VETTNSIRDIRKMGKRAASVKHWRYPKLVFSSDAVSLRQDTTVSKSVAETIILDRC
jgi:hypothetical protein